MSYKKKSAVKINFGETGDPQSRKIAKGEPLEGILLDATETDLDGKPHNYTMQTLATEENPNGELVTFLGTASLDRLIKDEVGSQVRLTYVGDVKSGGGFNVKQFEVEVWEDESEPESEPAPKSKK